MPKMDILDVKGNVVGDVELSERVFGIEPNEPVVHEVVVALLANKRDVYKRQPCGPSGKMEPSLPLTRMTERQRIRIFIKQLSSPGIK